MVVTCAICGKGILTEADMYVVQLKPDGTYWTVHVDCHKPKDYLWKGRALAAEARVNSLENELSWLKVTSVSGDIVELIVTKSEAELRELRERLALQDAWLEGGVYYTNEEHAAMLAKYADVITAAKKVRHWHDACFNPETKECEGMVVSSKSVRELWEALRKLEE